MSTSLVESAVHSVIGDRFKRKRQLRWTPAGAIALLHIRVANINGELADQLQLNARRPTRHGPANQEDFACAA
ncbi:MAG: hypothetical protein ACREMA_15790 [Longimicrobiales bacterium]